MALVVVEGAELKCDMGEVPVKLKVTSQDFVTIDDKRVATIEDCTPEKNVPPRFGTCIKLTALKEGVPQPCNLMVFTEDKWKKCTDRKIDNHSVLTKDADLKCIWEGRITILDPGQTLDDTE